MSVLERCPSYKELNKGSKQRQEPAQSRCPFYRGVRLIEVSVKRESTVYPNGLVFFMILYPNRLGEKYVVNSAKEKNTKVVFPCCGRRVGWTYLLV